MPARSPDPELARAYDAAMEAEEYQTSLPEPDSFPQFQIPSFLGTVIEILAWVFAIATALFLITVVVRLIMARRRRLAEGPSDGDGKKHGPVIRAEDLNIDLDKIKAMAAEGRLADAIHLLLLQTLQSLGRLSEIELDPSWTSREILRRISLAPAAGEALQGLVSMVEISHFGDADPTPDDFERCLQRYESFIQALRGESS